MVKLENLLSGEARALVRQEARRRPINWRPFVGSSFPKIVSQAVVFALSVKPEEFYEYIEQLKKEIHDLKNPPKVVSRKTLKELLTEMGPEERAEFLEGIVENFDSDEKKYRDILRKARAAYYDRHPERAEEDKKRDAGRISPGEVRNNPRIGFALMDKGGEESDSDE